MEQSLIDGLRILLTSYAEPCVGDCDHSQCPLLRELHALRIKASLECARETVKPIVDRERKGEEIGDLMNVRLDAAAPPESIRVAGESATKTIDWLGDMEVRRIEPCSDSARRAAEECESLITCLLAEDKKESTRQKFAAIINRAFAATPAQPSPSLADAIAKVREMEAENKRNYEYWKSTASDPTDMGVMKFLCWAGEDSRVIAALESLTPSNVVLVSREEAAKVAESAFEPAHTYASENTAEYVIYDNGQRRAIQNIAAAIRSLPAYGDRKDG